MKALPPAGQELFLPRHNNKHTCIYVGGISAFYGFPLLMEAFHLLNANECRYKLILVCREKEFRSEYSEQSLPEWLEVHHASGKELEPLYAKADIGLLTLTKNAYSDLAIGTKLFQYLSYGLPVISTEASAMTAIIWDNQFDKISPMIQKLLQKQFTTCSQMTKCSQNIVLPLSMRCKPIIFGYIVLIKLLTILFIKICHCAVN